MERTYAHLTDEDYIKKAEEKRGLREPEEDNPLTPPVCDGCGEPLDGEWKSCPHCGMTYTPDARDAEEKMQDDIKQDYREMDPSDTDTMDKLDQLDTLLDDPEIKQLLHERLDE